MIESGRDEFRIFLFELTEHKAFSFGILLLIFINTILIGIQTSEEIMAKSGLSKIIKVNALDIWISILLHELPILYSQPENIAVCTTFSKYSLPIYVGWYIAIIDNCFLAVYIMELLLKLYVWRLRYFKLGWNVFGIRINYCYHHYYYIYICVQIQYYISMYIVHINIPFIFIIST